MRKILIGLICLISLIWLTAKPAYAAATLSLSPASATKNIGDVFNVDIVVNTGGDPAAGVSAIVNYDTARLTAVQVTAGTVLAGTPLTNTVNSSTGTIQYDTGNLTNNFTGTGTVATIQFRALAAGSATVNYVFNAGVTSNTSIVAAAGNPTNLLATVNGGVYTIGSGTTTTTTTTLPRSGVVENTLIAIGGGVLFLIIGLITRLSFRA